MVSFYEYLHTKRTRIIWEYKLKIKERNNFNEQTINLFQTICNSLSEVFRIKKICVYYNGAILVLGKTNGKKPLTVQFCVNKIRDHLKQSARKVSSTKDNTWQIPTISSIYIFGGIKLYYMEPPKDLLIYDYVDGTYDRLEIDDLSDIENAFVNSLEINIRVQCRWDDARYYDLNHYEINIIPWLNVFTKDDYKLQISSDIFPARFSEVARMKNALQLKKIIKTIKNTTGAEFVRVLGPDLMPEVYEYGYKWVENINEDDYLK